MDEISGAPETDEENQDAKLKNRPLIRLELLKGFTYDPKKKEWTGGSMYDPESGKTYSCNTALEKNGKLKIRGYIGISLLGRTTYWTPV